MKKKATKQVVKKKASPKKVAGKKVSPSQAEPIPSTPSKAEAEALVAKRNLSPKDQEKLNERIRNLILLSKEQSFLTYKDINQALPDSVNNPDEIENVISILQNLEVEILDDSEVEARKARQEESEEKEVRTTQNDILDDPVRMYLKQMDSPPPDAREKWPFLNGSKKQSCKHKMHFLDNTDPTVPKWAGKKSCSNGRNASKPGCP